VTKEEKKQLIRGIDDAKCFFVREFLVYYKLQPEIRSGLYQTGIVAMELLSLFKKSVVEIEADND
jgi:hypothetical protein